MQVIWKDGMTKGDNAPMTVRAVEVESGSRISADLVVPLDPVVAGPTIQAPGEAEGLLEVIEEQLAAIDELTDANKGASGAEYGQMIEAHRDLQEWADQFPHLVEELCVALGLARNPVGPTGIPELDVIVRLMR